MKYLLCTLLLAIITLSVMSSSREGLREYSFTERIALSNIAAQKTAGEMAKNVKANRGNQKCDGPKRACKKVNKAIK
jgi:hypothetical protein